MSPEMSVRPEQHKPYSVVIPDVSRVDWANTVSELTIKAHDQGKMLAKTPEEILALFDKGRSAIVTDEQGNFLSHAGATFEYPDGRIEVGAVCTVQGREGNGFATDAVEALLTHLREMNPDKELITLANEDSKGVFQKLGGTEMNPAELHKEVWSACKGCKNKPPAGPNGEFKCCDTPMNLTYFKPIKTESGKIVFEAQSQNSANGASHAKI